MARCDVTLPTHTFVNGFTVLPAAYSDADSSGTMGSVSSLVGDSGYRGGSSRTNSSSGQSGYYDDQHQQQQWGPPRIMPISGKLEKVEFTKIFNVKFNLVKQETCLSSLN